MNMAICVITKNSFEGCEDISASKGKYICDCLHEDNSCTEICTQFCATGIPLLILIKLFTEPEV